jgi:hypothetical protein
VQDAGEGGLENVHLFVYDTSKPTPTLIWEGFTGANGTY